MNSLVKCYEADGVITLVFEKEIKSNSENNIFSTSSGDIISTIIDKNTISLEHENLVNRPLVINCTVEDVDSNINTFSRVSSREINYKKFDTKEDLCNYFLSNPSVELDGKLYYDAVDCNLYYDSLGQQPANDLSGLVLVYLIDEEMFVESCELLNGNCPGWTPPIC